MFEKVSCNHIDKIADRIAGALVDMAYAKRKDPKIAVEVLIGHHHCHIIAELSVYLPRKDVVAAVHRITGDDTMKVDYMAVAQDRHLAANQEGAIRCGDNGIFKGVPTNMEERILTNVAKDIYERWPYDGKYIISNEGIIICQSNARTDEIKAIYPQAIVNPLGEWTGGPNVDTGATNRKLGSDMGRCATGGGLHGKDLSKADVSVNIYAYLKANATGKPVELFCAIGDETIDGKPYSEIVEIARDYINGIGGFEKFAEWGLIR